MSAVKNDASTTASPAEISEPTGSELLRLFFEIGLIDLQLSDNNGKLELFISNNSNFEFLDKIGKIIQEEFGGKWLIKANGLDQSYWDLQIESSVLTLHREHYSGIMLFSAQESPDINADNVLLESIYRFISSQRT